LKNTLPQLGKPVQLNMAAMHHKCSPVNLNIASKVLVARAMI